MGRAVLLAVVLLIAGATGASAGEQQLTRVATDVGFFDADGGRYAVWGTDAGTTIEVLDTTDDRRFSVPKPADCKSPYVESGGGLLGGSQLLLACGRDLLDPATRWVLVDILSGAVRDVPRNVPQVRATDVMWESVGQRWIAGTGECGARECLVWLDLATGRALVRRSELPGRLRDLDHADLRPVCGSRNPPPLERPNEGQYFLGTRRSRLRLRRCGRRPIDLGRFSNTAIAGPLVVATSSTSLFAYEIRARQRHRWSVPLPNRVARDYLPRPLATRAAALVAVVSREDCDESTGDCFPNGYDLYGARLRPAG